MVSVTEWPNKVRKFFALGYNRNYFVNVDHDKAVEEAVVDEEAVADGEDSEDSGDGPEGLYAGTEGNRNLTIPRGGSFYI